MPVNVSHFVFYSLLPVHQFTCFSLWVYLIMCVFLLASPFLPICPACLSVSLSVRSLCTTFPLTLIRTRKNYSRKLIRDIKVKCHRNYDSAYFYFQRIYFSYLFIIFSLTEWRTERWVASMLHTDSHSHLHTVTSHRHYSHHTSTTRAASPKLLLLVILLRVADPNLPYVCVQDSYS